MLFNLAYALVPWSEWPLGTKIGAGSLTLRGDENSRARI